MPRVREIEIDEVPADARPVYQRFANEYGPFLNQVKIFAHRPPALRHIMGLLLELADEAVLDKRYLEIALVVVSKLNECEYCVAHHAPRLMDQGLSAEAAENILADQVPGFDEVDMLVRDYAMQVTETPGRIRDAMHERLHKHFSEEQIVELTLRTALCGFFNRFNDAMGIEMEDGVEAEMLARASGTGD
ncbi:MAG: carboxymuconolactone decarboxylase family protein [Rhodospirillaceae bacterium]|nr:carboxymuconolactone decarboxylase family protein [Rhodospirillaceae bacterium]MBT5194735.1 carboxymuconolactone decarboxylase family protein [Rhodospirillaceae bacterium]MBT5898779.1 carboxymuconolactone decarboxylase family protein [Rhodospirillaceae bacterium]MBT6429589.1 carboxymuconolactone decarboxylase family protein [Rhodospirillaceae bacterium]MBT7759162.1 carboxymuconolactone decarboxylase family protein [Rhodospirillaceae bacterium]